MNLYQQVYKVGMSFSAVCNVSFDQDRDNAVTRPWQGWDKAMTRPRQDWEKTRQDWDKTETRLRQDWDKTETSLCQNQRATYWGPLRLRLAWQDYSQNAKLSKLAFMSWLSYGLDKVEKFMPSSMTFLQACIPFKLGKHDILKLKQFKFRQYLILI